MTPEPYRPPPPAEPSALPIVALVLALLGLCLPPLLLVAIVLAVISLVKSNEPAFATRKGLAIAALVVPLAFVPIVGVLAAIAIPNFIKFQSRSKAAECKANLKAAFIGAKLNFEEHDAYSPYVRDAAFSPEPGNRYLYVFDATGPLQEPGGPAVDGAVGVGPDTRRHPSASPAAYRAAIPPDLVAELGVRGTCPDCTFTAACVGNIDNDATLDVWSISSKDRVDADGLPVPAASRCTRSTTAASSRNRFPRTARAPGWETPPGGVTLRACESRSA